MARSVIMFQEELEFSLIIFCSLSWLVSSGLCNFNSFGMGKSKLPVSMIPFAWSILMAFNIAFSNIWGNSPKRMERRKSSDFIVLSIGIVILILSTFIVSIKDKMI